MYSLQCNLLVEVSGHLGTSLNFVHIILNVFLKSHLPPFSNKLYVLTQLLGKIPATTLPDAVTFLTVML